MQDKGVAGRMEENVVSLTRGHSPPQKLCTSSVSPELLQRFARALAHVAFLWIMALLSKNMKAIWRASFLQSQEQADQCNNSGQTEEVVH